MGQDRVPKKRASSDAVLQTLAWVRKQGFKPVPTHHASKAAIFREYAKPGYQPPGDDLWRTHEYGIGVCTGPEQSGPVDVDLDCEEAIYFAARFFPPTAGQFGRASKRKSHFLYRVEGASFEKQAFIDPVTNSTIIELRGDGGHQTILPGSVHESTGETISWESVAFPDLPTVAPEILARCARKVAIATVLVRHVWAAGYHNEPTKHLSGMLFYLDWSVEEAEDLIAAVMDYTNDTDKSRLPTVRATYKRGEAGKKVSGAGVLRKQLKNDAVIDRLLDWAGSPTINLLQEYNDRYAVVSIEGKFRVAFTDTDAGQPPVFFMKNDWLDMVSTDYTEITVDDKVKIVPKGVLWLRSARRRSYASVDFVPGAEDDGRVLNLWGGWAIEPSEQAYRDGGCDGFLDLLFDVICGGDGDLAVWLMNWFANIVHEPMRKSMTAPVLIGPEGAGKSLMVGYFGEILGPAYTVVTQDKHVVGAFNKHLASTLLLHSEEALYGGERKHANIIRSLITDEFRMFEQKNIDAKRVKNFLRLILLSNLPNAAPAMPGDRRYTVFDMGKRKAPDSLIKKVLREKDSTGPAALFHYLLHEFDYNHDMARTNIKNDSLIEMKTHNMAPLEGWWFEVLMSGQLLPDRLAWAQKPDKTVMWPSVIGAPALHAAMEVAMRARNIRHVAHDASFRQHMARMTGRTFVFAQKSFSNELVGEIGVPQNWTLLSNRQLAITNFPTLQECRDGFVRHIGQEIDWPEIEPEGREVKGHEGPDY